MSPDQIKDGDIFTWRYEDEKPGDLGPWKRYHCKSQICVAKDGVLRDTYWNMGNDESWSYDEAQRKLALTYVGNFSELQKVDEWKADFYDDQDCVNLNHANSSKGNFYIRKDVPRSRTKMLAVAAHKKERAENDARFALERAQRFGQAIEQIEAGTDLNEIWL